MCHHAQSDFFVSLQFTPMTNIDADTKITLIGERAAMGGYLPQYDEFAIRVYEAIETGDLEEIRVADREENVGKLDDIVYVTNHDVFAYQVKWNVMTRRKSASIKCL